MRAVVAEELKASQAQEMVNHWYGEANKRRASCRTGIGHPRNCKSANPASLEGLEEIEMVSYRFNVRQ
ncbi:hypothetical protein O9929_09365 [Vibrio lentus]|nr:hypothetical protein [Vibrio lentus]